MRVCVTADLHGCEPPEIPDCDLLLIAGDIAVDEMFGGLTVRRLGEWLDGLRMPVVAIAGNHDFRTDYLHELPWIYLEDQAREVIIGARRYTIWGSPWSPVFFNWAFMKTDPELGEVYANIPENVDIIVTHGPPWGFGDLVKRGPHVGTAALRNRIERYDYKNLALVACGHIHEGYGEYDWEINRGDYTQTVKVVNGSLMDEVYDPVNKPIVVEIGSSPIDF